MLLSCQALSTIYILTLLSPLLQAQILSVTSNLRSNLGPPVFASSNPSRLIGDRRILLDSALVRRISYGAEQFALEFITRISNEHLRVPNRSYMVSPFAVWSLMLLLAEGAEGNTLEELRNVLHIDRDQAALRSAYREIQRYLKLNTTTIEVASFQALFTDINKPVNRDYEDIIARDYDSLLIAVDFLDVNNTFTKINDDINRATRGLLPYSVTPQDFRDPNLLMISSLYFKGQWQHPFEKSDTHLAPFYDEHGNVLGNVEMMTQTGPFIYVGMKELGGHVLELPYGKENILSMLVILPRRDVTVNRVVNNLRHIGIAPLFEQLRAVAQDFEDQPVEIYLPKFTTQSHFSLRGVLTDMGIADAFEPAFANLSKLSKDVYVSSIVHATRIIVNEEGTEAAAIAAAVLANKATPPKFYVDRPFVYLIVEKKSNLLLFAGEVKSVS